MKAIKNAITEKDSIGFKWSQNDRQRNKFYVFKCKSCPRTFTFDKIKMRIFL